MKTPAGFSWVIPGELAAMSRPWDLVGDMEFLSEEGIRLIVSLTVTPLKQALIEEFGFDYEHIPIRDFHAPTPQQVEDFVRVITQARRDGKKAVVHCAAGRGRTGTMLACYLVSLGRTAAQALKEVRALRPGSVETREQETAIGAYARKRARHKSKKKTNKRKR